MSSPRENKAPTKLQIYENCRKHPFKVICLPKYLTIEEQASFILLTSKLQNSLFFFSLIHPPATFSQTCLPCSTRSVNELVYQLILRRIKANPGIRQTLFPL
ncbi:hypothetical protein CEXT_133581 [Caerostris extrusa]|uniref:Uncharacterized protein n=1 Tax=Caerostris extrusa TaxID=172846 RepID=A0AAV4NAS5_CAEEX|nr:hypothetical protein CEXT_133581 [Caerostris extrusa]